MPLFSAVLCPVDAQAIPDQSKEAVSLKNKDKIKRLMILPHMADEEPHSDVLGSYTGTGTDGESPVQDVDDL